MNNQNIRGTRKDDHIEPEAGNYHCLLPEAETTT